MANKAQILALEKFIANSNLISETVKKILIILIKNSNELEKSVCLQIKYSDSITKLADKTTWFSKSQINEMVLGYEYGAVQGIKINNVLKIAGSSMIFSIHCGSYSDGAFVHDDGRGDYTIWLAFKRRDNQAHRLVLSYDLFKKIDLKTYKA